MKPSDITHNAYLTTEAAVAATLALAHRDPAAVHILHEDAGMPPILVGPRAIHLESLERFNPTPHRPEIHVALHSARDLHAYTLAQTVRNSSEVAAVEAGAIDRDTPAIFADRDTMTLQAYMDYHHAGSPRWLNHTAKVQFKHSHQFKRWQEHNNKHLTQEQFALFIDEMLADFLTPSGAEMISFATCLSTHSDTEFKSSTRLATGESELIFTDKRNGDVSTAVVEEFTIGIPIWQGDEKTTAISAKLFHRIIDVRDSSGNLTGAKSLRFWFHLRHLERIIDVLFAEEVAYLRTAFEGIAPIYNGTPPAMPKALPLESEDD
jgi:hypothetical protein